MIDSRSHASRLCGYPSSLEGGADRPCCPAAEQSGEVVAAWLSGHGSPGEAVVVFFKQYALCQFLLDEIRAWRGRHLHLVEHGAFNAQGFAVDKPNQINLRILRPSAAAVEAAVRGMTLQHCKPVNERKLSGLEEALADRLHRAFARES